MPSWTSCESNSQGNTSSILVSSALALLLCFSTQAFGQEITYADLLDDMVDLRWLAVAPHPEESGRQFSSYDRKSHAGREDRAAWYANNDRGQFLREETRAGRTEYVLADCDGPGAVVRIWSANPSGDLHFFIDGVLALTVPFEELCSGETAPFLAPLSGVRSRGWNCYVPLPFQRHLKITSTSNDFYYHVNVRTWPPGTRVPSLSRQLLADHEELLERNRKLLSNPETLYPPPTSAPQPLQGACKMGETERLLTLTGPGMLRRLALRPRAEDLRDALRAARLMVFVDGAEEPVIDCPLGDFFGTAPDLTPYAGLPLGVREDGLAYCHFPMPFATSLVVELCMDGGAEATALELDGEYVFEKGDVANLPLRLHAGWRTELAVRTQPRTDYEILDVQGQGRFVGCALSIRNPLRIWWGEGDEHFFVDGEDFPSTFGTGTEDYFGYAWCSADPFQHAYHNQPRCDGPGNYGWTSVNRFHVLDQVPFQRSFRFDMEVWHWRECQVDLASVAYWYGEPGSAHGFKPVPWERRWVRPAPELVVKRVQGALEAEDLKVLACTGGTHQVQDMASFSPDWSREKQLWWMDAAEGDTLDLALPVAATGRYEVRAQFTRAVDYGIVTLSLDGQQLGEPIDLYHDGVVATGEIALGTRDLSAGQITLRLTLAGANEKAVKRHMVGLDYVLLKRLR